MKTLKQLVALLLLCAMCVSTFAACGAPANDDVTTDGADTNEAVESKTEELKEEPAAAATFDAVNAANLYTFDENEKPLDRIVTDGGLCSIFQTVAIIGDSMSAGQLEIGKDQSGKYPDTMPYAWGTYMARDCGFKVHNFSRGGMTAREYVTDWADQPQNQFFSGRTKAQAYFIALGINDHGQGHPIGTVDDINHKDYKKNADTYIGNVAKIMQRYKEISPDAFFFIVTKPRYQETEDQYYQDLVKAIYALADEFNQTYVIDLAQYAPIFDAEFQERFFLRGHMNPMGYRYVALLIESYVDYIIRHDPAAFREVGFINTDFYTLGDKAK